MKGKSAFGRACVWFIALCFGMTSFLLFAAQEQTNSRDAREDYPWLVQGLQKFNHPRYSRSVVATLKGWGRRSCQEIRSAQYVDLRTSSECRLIALNLVTVDGGYFEARIILHESEEAIFLHELWPDFGKYAYWNPVIDLFLSEESKNTGEFTILALRLVGRFKMDTMDTGIPKNWLKDYREERYD